MRWRCEAMLATAFVGAVACTNASSSNGATDDAGEAPGEASPRFGSHAPCDASAQCPDGEACGYLVALGCAAQGECITTYMCSEHVPTWCGCDDKSHYEACPPFAGGYWAPLAVQATGFCPSDDAGAEPCDGAPPGGACSADHQSCCGGSFCSPTTLTCCLPQYAQCTTDEQCCGGRCSDENARIKRCL